ncbi:MAG TPA: hypothetical protein VKZ92_06585, partial [Pseudohongiella sp.]|nr:hypothetical protein [Pseudohongiella sp.]
MRKINRLAAAVAALLFTSTASQAQQIDWSSVEEETLRHFQAMIRLDTTDPPGREIELTNYLVGVLQQEGIEVEVYSNNPERPNVVARLRG